MVTPIREIPAANGFRGDRMSPSLFRILLAVCVSYGRHRGGTLHELGRLAGMRPTSALLTRGLKELERRGLIKRVKGLQRTIIPACTVEVLTR